MAYFDFFCKNINSGKPPNAEAIRGTCRSMCPEDEVLMREKVRMVHILEVSSSGEKKLVKCYSRSAADSVVALPHLLRPYDVLMDTVNYLLFEVTKRNDVTATVIYDFVNDRLRAVRQDMTVQRISNYDSVCLLEPMIRFHVYYGYKLCKHPIKVYDPVLNKKYLLECLKWFLSCCDSIDQATGPKHNWEKKVICNYFDMSEMEAMLSQSRRNAKPSTKLDRELMESLYILCNLGNDYPIFRYWTLSKKFKSNAAVRLAYEIAVANLRGNYIHVCKQLEHLCPLTFYALCLYLPELQRKALLVMSAAYNSKQLSVPLCALRSWLQLNSDEEARQVCAHYGLKAQGNAVIFGRGDFLTDVPFHEPITPFLQDKLDLSIDYIFSYLSKS